MHNKTTTKIKTYSTAMRIRYFE